MGRITHPELFQGKLTNKHYFEGWYYKLVNQIGDTIYAIIPGIALDKKFNTSHAFIQVLNGKTSEYWYFEYPVASFSASPNKFEIKIDNNIFSWDQIHLDIHKDGHDITGDLSLKNHQKLPWSRKSPNIMGWTTYLTFLECKHGVLSMDYLINGNIVVDNSFRGFIEGKGYLEKDFGTSFPKSWIWIQSNHFQNPNLSFFLSIANVPLWKFEITGFICNLWWNNQHIRFATYNGAKLYKLEIQKERVKISLIKYPYLLEVDAKKPAVPENQHTAMMRAPISGQMQGKCAESITSSITIRLFEVPKDKKHIEEGKRLLFEDVGENSGLEIMASLESLNLTNL